MATQSLILGDKGLCTDVAPYSLPPSFFNAGLNMRFKDGSLQNVPRILSYAQQPLTDANTTVINPLRITQYTPDGSFFLTTAVVGFNSAGNLAVNLSAFNPSNSTTNVENVAIPAELQTGLNYTYGIDLFAFNGLLILNTKNTIPMYYNGNDANFGTAFKPIPNWVTTSPLVSGLTVSAVSGTTIVFNQTAAVVAAVVKPNTYLSVDVAGTIKARVISVSANSCVVESATGIASGNSIWVNYPFYARGMGNYGGRLIATNLYAPDSAVPPGDQPSFSPIELAWSQPISALQSLNGVVWESNTTNSAGNDYLTDTPGEILASVIQSQYLVAYKNDSVYQVQDIGPPSYLVAQVVQSDDGIMFPRGVAEISSQQHLVVGNRGIYLHQGGIEKKNISRGKVEELFLNSPDGINLARKGLAFTYHNVVEKEVWICYPSKNQVLLINQGVDRIQTCNRALCYNYLFDTWYLRSLNNVSDIFDNEYSQGYVTLVAAPLATTAGAIPTTLSYFPVVGGYSSTSPDIFETVSFAQFDDRDLGNSAQVKNCNGVYPHCEFAVNVQLRFRNSHQILDWTQVTQRYLNPNNNDYRLDYRETGRFLHVRISAAGATSATTVLQNPFFSKVDLDLEERGRR